MGAALAGIPNPHGLYDNDAAHTPATGFAEMGTSGSDTACPAGTRTAVQNLPVNGGALTASLAPGATYNVLFFCFVVISLGATPPSALVLDVSGGSSWTVPTQLLVANANLLLSFTLVRQIVGGSTPGLFASFGVNPTGQAVTYRANSGFAELVSAVSPG